MAGRGCDAGPSRPAQLAQIKPVLALRRPANRNAGDGAGPFRLARPCPVLAPSRRSGLATGTGELCRALWPDPPPPWPWPIRTSPSPAQPGNGPPRQGGPGPPRGPTGRLTTPNPLPIPHTNPARLFPVLRRQDVFVFAIAK